MADEKKVEDKKVEEKKPVPAAPKPEDKKKVKCCSDNFFCVCGQGSTQQFFVRKSDVTLTTSDTEGTSIVLHSGKIIVVKESLEEVNGMVGITG